MKPKQSTIFFYNAAKSFAKLAQTWARKGYWDRAQECTDMARQQWLKVQWEVEG